jgi:hypothetical protein
MYIVASGGYQKTIKDNPEDLKALLKSHCRTQFRRIDRFIQLALLGSALCVQKRDIAQQCGLYLSSNFGALSNPIAVFDQIFNQKIEPKPLNFINTLGNSACFYLANSFALTGINTCVSSGNCSFEAALAFAEVDFTLDQHHYALVGAVDECPTPTASHLQRLKLTPEHSVEDASFWLLLSNKSQYQGHQKLSLFSFTHWQDVKAHVEHWRAQPQNRGGDVFVSADINEPLNNAKTLHAALNTETTHFSSSQTAQALNYLHKKMGRGVLISQNANGPFNVMQIDI